MPSLHFSKRLELYNMDYSKDQFRYLSRVLKSAASAGNLIKDTILSNTMKIVLVIVTCVVVKIIKYIIKSKSSDHSKIDNTPKIILNNPNRKLSIKQHSIAMLNKVQNILLGSKNRGIYSVGYLDRVDSAINTLRNFRSISGGTLLNNELLKDCNYEEMLVYECMVITELLMEGSQSTQSKKIENDLGYVSDVLITTIKKHKIRIKPIINKIKIESQRVLLAIEELSETQDNPDIAIDKKYQAEFIGNLHMILYMISKEDLDNIDKNFIKRVKAQIPTHHKETETTRL